MMAHILLTSLRRDVREGRPSVSFESPGWVVSEQGVVHTSLDRSLPIDKPIEDI